MEKINNTRDKYDRKKTRILMKGIKIGVKKGGKKVNIAGIMGSLK